MFRTTYYRSYTDTENKIGTNFDEFCVPSEASSGTTGGKRYDLIDKDDGLVGVGLHVEENDVIIGKTTPVTATSEGEAKNKTIRKDASMTMKTHEEGIIDSVMITQNENGKRMVKVKMRKTRIPIIGDKLASRNAQKGIIGMKLRQEDMPFTVQGITPDIILNSHAIPSRMTINQLLECVGAKVACENGDELDVTAFEKYDMDKISQSLHDAGYQRHGWERMYNPSTGKPMESLVFIGPTYYQRLKHMVQDKYHSRDTGITQTLTRQPTEGRSKMGGLRLKLASVILRIVILKS